jgi:SOS response regulatory protein OraA/RecX
MFLLVVFTELQSRGVSKQRIDNLKEELNIDGSMEVEYSQRKDLKRKALLAQEEQDLALSKEDIEENYPPR